MNRLLKDKRGLELRYWVISTIIFSGIFALFVIAFQDATTQYERGDLINPEIEARYNKLSDSADLVDEIKTTTTSTGGLRLLSVGATIFTATIGVASAVLNSITFIPTIAANIGSDFGIPTVVTNTFFLIATLIITILIIFAILSAIRK